MMVVFLLIVVLALLVGVGYFWFAGQRLTKRNAQLSQELGAARLEAQQAWRECEAEKARATKEARDSLANAQALVDQQIAATRDESERVRQHYEAEVRKIQDAADESTHGKLAILERLRRYESVLNAEEEAQRVLSEAIAEATALRDEARSLVDQARTAAQDEQARAAQSAQDVYEQANARLNQAIRDAGRIVADAERRAKEIAGAAFDALRDKVLLEGAAEAARNVVEGYGDRYVLPAHSVLDDLAAEFGYTSAGESLKSARMQSRRMVEQGEAAACDYAEANRRETAIRFVVDAFNGRVDAILSRVGHDNHGVLEQEARDAFALVNLNGQAFRNARIQEAYLDARMAELKWAVVVRELARKQREEQRYVKERMRDEEKARKEYEAQMRQASKEEEMKKRAVEDMEKQLADAKAALAQAAVAEKEQWERRIADLQESNVGLQQELIAAQTRALTIAQQTKKGHVYIISNVGSFGEGVFKIGQTRRLNRQDRIDELGDASVPFDFDVHAWIETENAPALEHKLQRRFLQMQINKVNSRKEFFRVTLAELREEVEKLKGEDAFTITHWTDIAAAAEYRESVDIEGDAEKLEKWSKRESALTERQLRLDALRLSVAAAAEPDDDQEVPALSPQGLVGAPDGNGH